MAAEKRMLRIENPPKNPDEALELAAALAGGDNQDFFKDNDRYKGSKPLTNAKELVKMIQDRKTSLEEFGKRQINAMPALPETIEAATTQEQLDMLALKHQIIKTVMGYGNQRSDIDIYINPDRKNPDKGIQGYLKKVEKQYKEIEALYNIDNKTQDISVFQPFLDEQMRAHNTLLSKLDHYDDVRSTIEKACASKKPLSKEDWARISNIQFPPQTISDIKKFSGRIEFYAQLEQQKIAVTFIEMAARQASLKKTAETFRKTGNNDKLLREKARIDALQNILDKKDKILTLVQAGIKTGEINKTQIEGMAKSEKESAMDVLQSQEEGYAVITQTLNSLRDIYKNPEQAAEDDPLDYLIDNSGAVVTLAQAKLLSEEHRKRDLELATTELNDATANYAELEELKGKFDARAKEYKDNPDQAEKLKDFQDRSKEIDKILKDKEEIAKSFKLMNDNAEAIQKSEDLDEAKKLYEEQRKQLSIIKSLAMTTSDSVTRFTTSYEQGGVKPQPPAAAEAAPDTSSSSGGSSRRAGGSPSAPTTPDQQIAALRKDAEALINYKQDGEKKLSDGHTVLYGTATMSTTVDKHNKAFEELTKKAEEIEAGLRNRGEVKDADSIKDVLDELRKYRDETSQIDSELKELDTQAKELKGEIDKLNNASDIQKKLKELKDINTKMQNIVGNKFLPAKNKFGDIIKNNKMLDEQLNGNMTLSDFARRYLGELGRRLVGEDDGGPSLFKDFANAAINRYNKTKDWWVKEVGAEHGNSAWYMGANVLGLTLLGAAGISLWNNTGGKLMGFELHGIWRFLAVGAIALYAMSQTKVAEAYTERKDAQDAFAKLRKEHTRNVVQTGGNSPLVDTSAGQQNITIRDTRSGETKETITIPPSKKPMTLEDFDKADFSTDTGKRTVQQGSGNHTPDGMPKPSESVSGSDSKGATPSTTTMPPPTPIIPLQPATAH
ncbi:MAG: hypothetical protein OEY94_03215 [Alphaproteobacteria bacterium]|nr:hypothetical protein [Alphaproteobacteria bacterium]